MYHVDTKIIKVIWEEFFTASISLIVNFFGIVAVPSRLNRYLAEPADFWACLFLPEILKDRNKLFKDFYLKVEILLFTLRYRNFA
jgi:hypothetical protein